MRGGVRAAKAADPEEILNFIYPAVDEGGTPRVLFGAESGPIKSLPALPDTCDAVSTARWIKRVLAREAQAPLPLVNQLACCLYASGYSQDFNQAKAIAAVETGSLAAA